MSDLDIPVSIDGYDPLTLREIITAYFISDNSPFDGIGRQYADRYIDALPAAAQYLSGCLHPGNEPKSCQYEGQCLSTACNHNGKTWRGPRMTLEAQVDGILYPKAGT
jgi:hypothetical protein